MRPVSIVVELIEYLLNMDAGVSTSQLHLQRGSVPGSTFVSFIKFDNVPILPPVMTPERCEEMRKYRREAVLVETQLRARARKKLLAKVQSVVDEIEKRHVRKDEVMLRDEDAGISENSEKYEEISSIVDTQKVLSKHLEHSIPYNQLPGVPDLPEKLKIEQITENQTRSPSGLAVACVLTQEDLPINTPQAACTSIINRGNKDTVIPDHGRLVPPLNLTEVDPGCDSGISSRPTTATVLDSMLEGHLDTMADVTEISQEYEDDDVASLPKDSPRSEYSAQLAKDSPRSIDSGMARDDFTISDGDSFCVNTGQININEDSVSPASTLQGDSDHSSCDTPHTVRQVKITTHDKQVECTDQKQLPVPSLDYMQSTGSSQTTASSGTTASSEMNQTVIAKDGSEYSQSLASVDEELRVTRDADISGTNTRSVDSVTRLYSEEPHSNQNDTANTDTGHPSACHVHPCDPDDLSNIDQDNLFSEFQENDVNVYSTLDPRWTLLSRVDLNVDPDTCPGSSSEDRTNFGGRQEISDSSTVVVEVAFNGKHVERSPINHTSPPRQNGSVQTSNLQAHSILPYKPKISHASPRILTAPTLHRRKASDGERTSESEQSEASPAQPPTSRRKPSSDEGSSESQQSEPSLPPGTSELNTYSTDLGQYMTSSAETGPSSNTTLPHINATLDDLSDLETQSTSQIHAVQQTGEIMMYVPEQADQSGAHWEGLTNKPHCEAHTTVPARRERKRHDSYTLDHPSPVLLAAKSRLTGDDLQMPAPHNVKSSNQQVVQQKPVQPQAVHVHPEPAKQEAEPTGNKPVKAEPNDHQFPQPKCERNVPSKGEPLCDFQVTSSMQELNILPRKLSYDDSSSEMTKDLSGDTDQNTSVLQSEHGREEYVENRDVSDSLSASEAAKLTSYRDKAGQNDESSSESEATRLKHVRYRIESEREGKQEHLQRYLCHLTEMPQNVSSSETEAEVSTENRPEPTLHRQKPQPNKQHQQVQQQYLEQLTQMPQIPANNERWRDTSLYTYNTDPQKVEQAASEPYTQQTVRSFGAHASSDAVSMDGTSSQGTDTLGTASDEELLQLQMAQFEHLRKQLLVQQQQQLAMLLAEQERQQQCFQTELLQQTQMQHVQPSRPRSKQRRSRDAKDMTGLQPNLSPSNGSLPGANLERTAFVPAGGIMHVTREQQQHKNSDLNNTTDSYLSLNMNNSHYASNQFHTLPINAINPIPALDVYNDSHSIDPLNHTVGHMPSQPVTAPGHRVHFAPDNDSSMLSSSPHHDLNHSVLSNTTDVSTCQSPAVLHRKNRQSKGAAGNHGHLAGDRHRQTQSSGGTHRQTQSPGGAHRQSQSPGGAQGGIYRHSRSPGGVKHSTDYSPSSLHKGQQSNSTSQQPHTQFKRQTQTLQPSVPVELHRCFVKLSAAVKGYLTRRLMRTDRVQALVDTIKDTAEVAIHLHQETPVKRGMQSMQDRELQERVLSQLTAAMYEVHEIFSEYTPAQRMLIIAQSRALEQERLYKAAALQDVNNKHRRLSAATMRAIDRKKKKETETVPSQQSGRSKSAPPPHSTSPGSTGAMNTNSGKVRRHPNDVNAQPMQPTHRNVHQNKEGKDSMNRATAKVSKNKASTAAVKMPRKTAVKPAPNAGVVRKVARHTSTVAAESELRKVK